MTDVEQKTIEMALEAFEMLDKRGGLGLDVHEYIRTKIEALHQALAQPEQEPVAWMCEGDDWGAWVPVVFLGNDLEYHKKSTGFRNWKPLYTAPPKREWVELTDEEFEQAVDGLEDLRDCWIQIEAKLKEKNT